MLGRKDVPILFLRQYPSEIIAYLPVISHHARHAILDHDEQQDDMLWVLGPWEEEFNGVYDTVDGTGP